MRDDYNYGFVVRVGIFVSSLGGLAQGIIYLDEFFLVAPSLMLLTTFSIFLEIYRVREEKNKLFLIFVRLCIGSILCGAILDSGFITIAFGFSGSWIASLRYDDST